MQVHHGLWRVDKEPNDYKQNILVYLKPYSGVQLVHFDVFDW